PSLQAVGWHAVYAPAGTPQRVVDQLSAEVDAAVHSPSVREKLLAQGLEPTGTTPQALSAIMAADIDHWRSVIKTTGFTAE
ncbi:MAG TPA: tripartite tricarboxylate transporter substrate-binding protein, partial [Casimicrobiaceae bacterium]|nr:tripartite tricarboxylate transporter substrate-binding protein [Casimicrobiaceae bacterium]